MANTPTPELPPVGMSIEDVTKSNPLFTEARKYKSAEEFVKANEAIYHGTPNRFSRFAANRSYTGGSAWFSTDKSATLANKVEASRPAGSKWNVMERFVNPNAKLLDVTTEEGKHLYDMRGRGELQSMGYDGIKFPPDAERGTYIELFNPNKDALTKSQLTDIWKKANAKRLRQ